ncbi:MAG: hypothetical protein ACE5DI_00105 [Candidatus Micrarchaeia archaeon]
MKFLGTRGQPSVEMITMVSLLVIILAGFSLVAFQNYSEFVVDRQFIEAKEVARQVATEINTAISVGSGYGRMFALRESFYGGEDYVVRTLPNDQVVEITWGSYRYTVPILSSNVEEKTLVNGNNTISNQGGLIKLA